MYMQGVHISHRIFKVLLVIKVLYELNNVTKHCLLFSEIVNKAKISNIVIMYAKK